MPGTDITASQRTIDPKIARMLAAFIRDNMDDLVSECVLRYHEDYAFSANSEIPVSDSERWTRGNLASLVTQLEECRPNPREYEYMTGDIVVQHFELLYGIDAFLEQCVFEAGVVAELIWERTIGDTRRMNVMLDALEAFTQARIVAKSRILRPVRLAAANAHPRMEARTLPLCAAVRRRGHRPTPSDHRGRDKRAKGSHADGSL